MDKETMRMKLTYWSGIIKEARASGMKISKWCEMNQITERQYYYWHKKVMHDTYTMALMSGMVPAIDVNQSQVTCSSGVCRADSSRYGYQAQAKRVPGDKHPVWRVHNKRG